MDSSIKQTVFIKAIIAEENMKRTLALFGEGHEAELARNNYEDLLDLIEKSGWYEEYRSFKIMAVLYYANQNAEQLLLSERGA